MHALAGERVEIDRERRDEGLAFARAHLRDRAFVQHEAADQLHVEMALLQGALGRLAHGGEGGNGEIIEALAGGEFGAERLGLAAQLFVGERSELRFERVDRRYLRSIALQPPIIGGAEQRFENRAEHFRPFRRRVHLGEPRDRRSWGPAAPVASEPRAPGGGPSSSGALPIRENRLAEKTADRDKPEKSAQPARSRPQLEAGLR